MTDKFEEAGEEPYDIEDNDKFDDSDNDDYEEECRDDSFLQDVRDAELQHREESGLVRGNGIGEAGDDTSLDAWRVEYPAKDKFSAPPAVTLRGISDNSALETYTFGQRIYVPFILMDADGNRIDSFGDRHPRTVNAERNKFGD